MLKVLFKPNCATCQTAMQLMKQNTDEAIETTEYLVDVPTVEQLREIVQMIGITPEELVRKKEPLYKELYEGKNITGDEWLTIMSQNPILIERPIIILGDKAIIGRPVERIVEFLNENKSR